MKDFKLIKELLDEKMRKYNRIEFIESDPVQIPHRFSKREDIEISALLAALIARGKRDLIIRSANKMMELMDHSPHDFLIHAESNDWKQLESFVHRTMNGKDFTGILKVLSGIYKKEKTLEKVFAVDKEDASVYDGILRFRNRFVESKALLRRSLKHVADPSAGSSAKRINLFLRWMVRKDKSEIDFGLWKSISANQLICPLDVHSGRVARELGLLKRIQNDWKAAVELTDKLKEFDPVDPVKYDIALFAIGVNEGGNLKAKGESDQREKR